MSSNEIIDKSTKTEANMRSCLQPMPKVLVSCLGLDGENNGLFKIKLPNLETKEIIR